MIVFTEIGIGLAIFGGFFTWWAAATIHYHVFPIHVYGHVYMEPGLVHFRSHCHVRRCGTRFRVGLLVGPLLQEDVEHNEVCTPFPPLRRRSHAVRLMVRTRRGQASWPRFFLQSPLDMNR